MGDISKDIQSKFESEKIKALINIKYTANWIENHQVAFFKPFDLSPQQYNILRILKGAGKAIKVQAIKNRMIVKTPNATRLMDKLCAKDLIERIPSPQDRREVHIMITSKGEEILNHIKRADKEVFLKNLTEEEAKQLSYLLDKIR